MAEKNKDLLTVNAVSKLTGLSKATIYNYLKMKLVKGAEKVETMYGSMWVIPMRWVKDYNAGKVDVRGAFIGFRNRKND
jgi:hypothetical protein